jgi:hypothetical protein
MDHPPGTTPASVAPGQGGHQDGAGAETTAPVGGFQDERLADRHGGQGACGLQLVGGLWGVWGLQRPWRQWSCLGLCGQDVIFQKVLVTSIVGNGRPLIP